MNLSEFFNELKSKGKEPPDIARDTGLSYPGVKKIAEGQTKEPRASTLYEIAETYGYVLYYDEQDNPNFQKKSDNHPAQKNRNKQKEYVSREEFEIQQERLNKAMDLLHMAMDEIQSFKDASRKYEKDKSANDMQ